MEENTEYMRLERVNTEDRTSGLWSGDSEEWEQQSNDGVGIR